MIDYINLKAEKTSYYADMFVEREAERIAKTEVARIQWAQRNGNDSGFDPYAGIFED